MNKTKSQAGIKLQKLVDDIALEKKSSIIAYSPSEDSKNFINWPTVNRPVSRIPGRRNIMSRAFDQRPTTSKNQYFTIQKTVFNTISNSSVPPSPKIPLSLSRASSDKHFYKTPMNRVEEELMMFKEVFVTPKKELLEELKLELQKKRETILNNNPRLRELLPENKVIYQSMQHEEIEVKEDYFNKQLHCQAPGGLNASTSAPLSPGGGWAPSIPAMVNPSIKDHSIKSSYRYVTYDIIKEAHFAFTEGVLNEKENKIHEAEISFKRFFYCAKTIQDQIGECLALNRLGVLYYIQGKTEKSRQFHTKMLEQSSTDGEFVAYYNIGVCEKELGDNMKAISAFEKSLEYAKILDDKHAECITLGQLGLAYTRINDFAKAAEYLYKCASYAEKLKHTRLQYEIVLSLGQLYNSYHNLKNSALFFKQAYELAKNLRNPGKIEVCACNLGVVLGTDNYEQKRENILNKIQIKNRFS
ncbi:unnamed protein product [Blepharisma stoltei]|uniref:Tetratricopeptide repeat protein 29 n=1 Tax=Blepharisma stoltei TaxID=1481888 RepID=A0AAU9JBX2_9CILI|nr:unnamed protein product [Blepharisma stoltei]